LWHTRASALVGIMERVGLFMEPPAGLSDVIGKTVGILVVVAVGLKVTVLVGVLDGNRLGQCWESVAESLRRMIRC